MLAGVWQFGTENFRIRRNRAGATMPSRGPAHMALHDKDQYRMSARPRPAEFFTGNLSARVCPDRGSDTSSAHGHYRL